MAKPARNTGRGRGRPPNSTRAGRPQRGTPFDTGSIKKRSPQGKNSPGRGFHRAFPTRSEFDLDWRAHREDTTAGLQKQTTEETQTELELALETKPTTTINETTTRSEPQQWEDDDMSLECEIPKEKRLTEDGLTDPRRESTKQSTEEAEKELTPTSTNAIPQDTTNSNNAEDSNNETTTAIELTAKSVYFAAANKVREFTPETHTEEHENEHQIEANEQHGHESANHDHDDDDEDEYTAHENELSDNELDSFFDEEEEAPETVKLPPVPINNRQPRISFSVIRIRAEFTSGGAFSPIPQTRELLRALMGHPMVLGCANADNKLFTPKIFPTTEKGYKKLIEADFSQLSRAKHRMTIVMDIATKESLDIVDLKTKSILEYLRNHSIFLDSHRYDEIATAEVGFFANMHDKITNRTFLQEYIEEYFTNLQDDLPPTFEIYLKNVYGRQGPERAFAKVVAIRCGRSDAPELTDFLCDMAKRKAFGIAAEFVPQGVPTSLLITKLRSQNQYISNTTAFPIQGLNRDILATEVQAGDTTIPLEEYIVKCSRAEKLEATQQRDRWLLVVDKSAYEHAVRYVDRDLVQLFEKHHLPRHPIHGIPHRPGSQYTRSETYNSYTESMAKNVTPNNTDKQFSRPPPRQPAARLHVLYAAAAATRPAKPPKAHTTQPKTTATPIQEAKRIHQSVRQQITNNNIELQADLTAQVKALQAQINALQEILTSLQSQVATIAQSTSPKTPMPPTTTTQLEKNEAVMASKEPSTFPRAPANKRQCTSQSTETTSPADQNFEDSADDPTTQESLTQPPPPNDPTLEPEPGELDSTLL